MNPYVLGATDKNAPNYWSLLHDLKFVTTQPHKHEKAILSMLSVELLNGKRPHELLLLERLLKNGHIHINDYKELLRKHELDNSALHLQSVERILNLSWFSAATAKKYGSEPLVEKAGGEFRLNSTFKYLYDSYEAEHRTPSSSFRAHVDDIVQTGLLLNRKHYGGKDQLVPGKLYSRKDACRLLNWKKNEDSTLMGYKYDPFSGTCPIFVTYHKDAAVEASQRYEDSFLNTSTLHWFTRNGRTLRSKELRPILSGEAELHLFVKREDAEGIEFHYLGKADAFNAQDSTMPVENGKHLDVVTTDLKLHQPLPPDLFEEITASKSRLKN